MVGIPSEMMNQNFSGRLDYGLKAEEHFYNLFKQNNILAYTSFGQSEVGDIWLPNLKSPHGKGFYLELKTKVLRDQFPDTGFNLSVAKNYQDNILNGKDTLIIFIDKKNGIYGNFFSNLFTNFFDATNKQFLDFQNQKSYPRVENNILYFHRNSLENIEYLKKYLQLNNLNEQELLKQV